MPFLGWMMQIPTSTCLGPFWGVKPGVFRSSLQDGSDCWVGAVQSCISVFRACLCTSICRYLHTCTPYIKIYMFVCVFAPRPAWRRRRRPVTMATGGWRPALFLTASPAPFPKRGRGQPGNRLLGDADGSRGAGGGAGQEVGRRKSLAATSARRRSEPRTWRASKVPSAPPAGGRRTSRFAARRPGVPSLSEGAERPGCASNFPRHRLSKAAGGGDGTGGLGGEG